MDHMSVIYFVNCSVDLVTLIIILFAFVLVIAYNYTLFTSFKRMSLILLLTTFIYVTFNFLSWISEYLCWPIYLDEIFIFLEVSFGPILAIVLTGIVLFYSHMDIKQSPIIYIVIGLYLIYMGMLVYNLFSKSIYYVSEDNIYYRGDEYIVVFIPVVLILIINIVLLLLYRKKIDKNMLSIFYVYIIVAIVSLILELSIENYSFISWGTAFSVMYLIFTMQIKQSVYLTMQRNEIERQKARIAVLEIRPHYIYNTMTSIYYLCGSNPEKAQEMTLYFTNYLRKNFNAVASEDVIPFSEEVEHTKAYLNVERVRLGNSLIVNTDIDHQNFKIPPLTLQPIVENAVKHGIASDAESLIVNISTHEYKTFHEVIVSNNGKWKEINTNSGDYSTLKNIQMRLKRMSHGKIEILNNSSGYTTVRIVIPK